MTPETSRSEDRLWLWTAATVALAIRVGFLLAHRVDSDEPQHLHIAWAWTRGLVQYRDVFDNHLPLLHLLFAPVMALMPESSTVFVLMRMAIQPFAIGCSLLLFAYARPTFGFRVAAIAALLFSVMPPWLSKSVELRNDTLWIFFWLAGLALLARPRGAAFVLAGIAFGLCLLASIKAVPLLLAHVLAGQIPWPGMRRVALGAAIPVIVISVGMLAAGALDDMVYGTLVFNAAAPVHPARRIGGAVAFVIIAAVIVQKQREHAKGLLLFAIWYVVLLLCFWPILTSRDFLPLVPLASLWLASFLWTDGLSAHRWPDRPWRLAMLAAILASILEARLWRTSDTRERFVDAAVAITAKDDFVFDLKGDAVFRRRPVGLVYEDVGRALTANGTLSDRGPEEIIARGCCAAMRDSSHLPPRTRAFLAQHFLGKGPIRVCGTDVTGDSFVIAVPQIYAVLARHPTNVVIDGIPYRGPRALAAGRHSLTSKGNEPVRVIWWRAAKEEL